MRHITIQLPDLLDLVNAADGGGFGRPMLLSALADWAGVVTDAEIAEYADDFLSPELRARGYSGDDRDHAIEGLTEWRDRYCQNGKRV
jgi:hypothetical protein